MILEAFGKHVTINELSKLVMPVDVGTDAGDLVKALTHYGVVARKWNGLGGVPTPAVCLVKYSGFNRSSVQDVNFKGWHWLILLAEDRLSVVTHDPDWWGTRRNEGAFKVYSRVEWDAAFSPYGSHRVAVLWDQQGEVTMATKVRVTSGANFYDLSLPISIGEVPTVSLDVWSANFYNGLTPGGTVLYSTTFPGPALNLNWGAGSPNAAVPPDNFSAVFVMTHNFTAGTYKWTVNSDDGFRLYVDGMIVPGLDGWIEQSAASKTYTGHVVLTAGIHTLKVDYFEKGGLAALKVSAPSPFM